MIPDIHEAVAAVTAPVARADIPSVPEPTAEPRDESAGVRRVASEFEAVFTAAMFKEGLKSAMKTGMDGEGGSSAYVEMTCDQLAQFIGRQGVLGIAEELTKHLTTQQGNAE